MIDGSENSGNIWNIIINRQVGCSCIEHLQLDRINSGRYVAPFLTSLSRLVSLFMLTFRLHSNFGKQPKPYRNPAPLLPIEFLSPGIVTMSFSPHVADGNCWIIAIRMISGRKTKWDRGYVLQRPRYQSVWCWSGGDYRPRDVGRAVSGSWYHMGHRLDT